MRGLKAYLEDVFGKGVQVRSVSVLGRKTKLKKFGYGRPVLVRFLKGKKPMSAVISTVKKGQFGHEFRSDRAGDVLLAYDVYNKLPKHVKAIDCGGFTKKGMESLKDCGELFLLAEEVEGRDYHFDLDELMEGREPGRLDLQRAEAMAVYLSRIHGKKKKSNELWYRRVRELLGLGECIFGINDSYKDDTGVISWKELEKIEKKCVEWRWRLKKMPERLCQVHGDFHPWNVKFGEGADFTVLDRSRGEWGEAADDVSAMSIDYIFYSLQKYGKMEGEFKKLNDAFVKTYLEGTGDRNLMKVILPFYAFRGLVVASPVWYPDLEPGVRKKLFGFVRAVLDTEEFGLADINSYFRG